MKIGGRENMNSSSIPRKPKEQRGVRLGEKAWKDETCKIRKEGA